MLRGVKVEVLGPPTVKQHEAVKGQRSKDPDEFWQLQASALQFANGSVGGVSTGEPLFPKHVRSRGPRFPIDARWLIYHARQLQGEQLLQIVRMLDDAMNNTSVILLFEVGDVRLLFSGDAQIGNWELPYQTRKLPSVLRASMFTRSAITEASMPRQSHSGSCLTIDPKKKTLRTDCRR